MPTAVKRAMLEDIEKNKLSHKEKHSTISVKTGRLISNKDDENLTIKIEKIKPVVRTLSDKFLFTQNNEGDVILEKNVEVDIFIGEEPEEGIEVEILTSPIVDEEVKSQKVNNDVRNSFVKIMSEKVLETSTIPKVVKKTTKRKKTTRSKKTSATKIKD